MYIQKRGVIFRLRPSNKGGWNSALMSTPWWYSDFFLVPQDIYNLLPVLPNHLCLFSKL